MGCWQLFADLGLVDKAFSSSPSQVWEALQSYFNSGQMATATASTLSATAIAFLVGTVLGTMFGFLLGLSQYLDKVLGPFIVPLNSIPRIALAPLFIVWFGLTQLSKIALAVTIVFFILAINARAAVRQLDPDIAMLARVAGVGRVGYLFKILLPSSIPALFAGIRLAITYSLLGVVASEMIAARAGLGQNIVVDSSTFHIAGVFAILLELALIASAINVLFNAAERILLRWQDGS